MCLVATTCPCSLPPCWRLRCSCSSARGTDVYWNGTSSTRRGPPTSRSIAADSAGCFAATPGYCGFIDARRRAVGAPRGRDLGRRRPRGSKHRRGLPSHGTARHRDARRARSGPRGRARSAVRARWHGASCVALAAGSPIAYQALLYGHPEDLLAAAASVRRAVLAARDGTRHALPACCSPSPPPPSNGRCWRSCPPSSPRRGRHAHRADRRRRRGTRPGSAHARQSGESRRRLSPRARSFHPHQIWWPFGVPAPAEFTAAGHGELTAPAGCPRSPIR